MKNRLFKDGKVTTIAGLLIIGGAVYMYLSPLYTQMEAAELGALGLIFLRSKDSLIGLSKAKKKK
jgi:hypothetical protein